MAVLFFKNNFFPIAKTGGDFIGEISFHHHKGVAFQNGDVFFAVSLNEGGSPLFYEISRGSPITLREWVLKSFGDDKPEESDYVPGTFYKRMWRPANFKNVLDNEKLNQSFVSLKILLGKLEELFETIEPNQDNSSTYGLKIREVILLACMEVESSLSAVLKENNYPVSGSWSTKDYVKLLQPMLLDAYEIYLQQYPNYPHFTPFKGWDSVRPTQSLPWYNAYNKTKHNREEHLNFATLENAILAVSAAVVVFHAQFGWQSGRIGDSITLVIQKVFGIITVDFEKYERHYYIPLLSLPLNSTLSVWTPLNYPF